MALNDENNKKSSEDDLSVILTATYKGESLVYSSDSRNTASKTKLNAWKIQPTILWIRSIPDRTSILLTIGSCAIVIFFIFVLTVLTFHWRNENAIKFSQKKILFLILFGCLLYMIGALMFGTKQTR